MENKEKEKPFKWVMKNPEMVINFKGSEITSFSLTPKLAQVMLDYGMGKYLKKEYITTAKNEKATDKE